MIVVIVGECGGLVE